MGHLRFLQKDSAQNRDHKDETKIERERGESEGESRGDSPGSPGVERPHHLLSVSISISIFIVISISTYVRIIHHKEDNKET